MVLGSPNRQELQKALNHLHRWAAENDLYINERKTVYMAFRKGGKLAAENKMFLGEEELTSVNVYKYLGITLQTTSHSFRHHIKERAAAAIRGIYDLKNITKLSLRTAMTLFHAKITPTISYGLELIWERLTTTDLTTIEKVKARFLKRAMGVARTSPSRLIYELARETFYIEDLRFRLHLPSTRQMEKVLEQKRLKQQDIPLDFYATEAMTDRRWTQENQDLRNVVTRLAVHGFHHKICKNIKYHEPSKECVCSLCEKPCDKYHITLCEKRVKSIVDYSKD